MNTLLAQNFDLHQIQVQSGVSGKFTIDNTSIGSLITSALPYVFTIAGMLLLIYLLFGGLQLMLSRGDPKATQAAKDHITNALVGFIIIFIAFWVVQLFGVVLGLHNITNIFGGGGTGGSRLPGGQ